MRAEIETTKIEDTADCEALQEKKVYWTETVAGINVRRTLQRTDEPDRNHEQAEGGNKKSLLH
ncbi:hypothetical protein BWI97_12015 [Siphonobacter sp. BAB-5405]|nr:hypothetical protein BWI97_12015 [Siphonobacter sp. BAB-5405]